MNVLHIGKFFVPFRGGVENYMRDAMVSLERQGVRCSAVVHRHDRSFRSRDDVLQIGDARFHVVRAGTWFRFMYTPFSPMFPVLMNRLLRRYRPDVLHLHMPNPSVFWVLFLLSARNIPWMVHWHADVVASTHDPRLRWFYRLYRPLEQRLLQRAQAIIVTSKAYLEFSKPLEKHRGKCHVVPLGLDPSQHSEREPAASTPGSGPFRVLAIGRLTYYKGFEYLIRAATLLTGIQVEIVGTGDQLKKLQSLVNELRLENRVRLLGSLPERDLQEKLDSCDCLCLPSIERTEAFGMVLLEAMLHGKPTVVSDVPGSGMGWVVEHGNTGITVKPADSQALANAIEYLQQHREEALTMGQQGRKRFDELFRIDRSTAALKQIYEQLATVVAAADDRAA